MGHFLQITLQTDDQFSQLFQPGTQLTILGEKG